MMAPIQGVEQQLIIAIQTKQMDKVQQLLEVQRVPATCRNQNGVSPLHAACKVGLLDLARRLADMGADVRGVDNSANTTLHFAAKGGHIDIVRWLVQLGVQVDARNTDNQTAYDQASNHVVRQFLLPLQLKAEANNPNNAQTVQRAAPMPQPSAALEALMQPHHMVNLPMPPGVGGAQGPPPGGLGFQPPPAFQQQQQSTISSQQLQSQQFGAPLGTSPQQAQGGGYGLDQGGGYGSPTPPQQTAPQQQWQSFPAPPPQQPIRGGIGSPSPPGHIQQPGVGFGAPPAQVNIQQPGVGFGAPPAAAVFQPVPVQSLSGQIGRSQATSPPPPPPQDPPPSALAVSAPTQPPSGIINNQPGDASQGVPPVAPGGPRMTPTPTSAHKEYKPIKADGFHSSASDKALQARYGHTSVSYNLAPPPTAAELGGGGPVESSGYNYSAYSPAGNTGYQPPAQTMSYNSSPTPPYMQQQNMQQQNQFSQPSAQFQGQYNQPIGGGYGQQPPVPPGVQFGQPPGGAVNLRGGWATPPTAYPGGMGGPNGVNVNQAAAVYASPGVSSGLQTQNVTAPPPAYPPPPAGPPPGPGSQAPPARVVSAFGVFNPATDRMVDASSSTSSVM